MTEIDWSLPPRSWLAFRHTAGDVVIAADMGQSSQELSGAGYSILDAVISDLSLPPISNHCSSH